MKAIFLDIDGVLQPSSSQKRFEIDRKALAKSLAEQYQDDIYTIIDEYDVAAVYCDWNKRAVQLLKDCMNQTGAKIILSSDWRETKDETKMRALFRIHGLDKYYVESMPHKDWKMKYYFIPPYVETHPLESYAVLDDMDMTEYVGTHMVLTRSVFTEKDAEHLIDVLNNRYEYNAQASKAILTDRGETVCRISYDCVEIDNRKIPFLLFQGEVITEYEAKMLLKLTIHTAHKRYEKSLADCVLMFQNGQNALMMENTYGYGIPVDICSAVYVDDGNIFRTDDFYKNHKDEIAKCTGEIFLKLMEKNK